jgi:hypothetical protein
LLIALAAFGLPAAAQGPARVQQLSGELGPGEVRLYRLPGLRRGEQLDLFLQTTSGDLDPFAGIVSGEQATRERLQAFQALRDYGGKPVSAANLDGAQATAAFETALPEGGQGYRLEITALDGLGRPAGGDFRLLVGVNAPQVLTGQASYFERFSTNLQIDFDFRQFPFDTQTFNLIIDMIYPQTMYLIEVLPGFSEIDPGHGEDEFIITNFEEPVSSQPQPESSALPGPQPARLPAEQAGRLILERAFPRAAPGRSWPLLAGLVLYVLLASIPGLGWVIATLVTAFGLGAAWLLYRAGGEPLAFAEQDELIDETAI